MAKPIVLSESNFKQEVLESDKPVLVDFWAGWCAPCNMIAPAVAEIADDYDGKIKVGKVDVDANQQIAANYGLRSIPTLLLFKDGKVVESSVGVIPKQQITQLIDRHLK